METTASCLMGMGDFLGTRLVLWDERGRVPARARRTVMEILRRGVIT